MGSATPKRKGTYFGRLGANRRFLLPISIPHEMPAKANRLVAFHLRKVGQRFLFRKKHETYASLC